MNGVVQHSNGVNGTQQQAQAVKAVPAAQSGLAKIEVPDDSPFTLFRQWHADASKSALVLPNALCLSTATKEGRVSSRNVIMRRLDDDGIVVMTDRRSKKTAELNENPRAAMTFLWCYKKDESLTVNQQVRLEGEMRELSPDEYGDIYEREPVFCKIRTHLCHQGTPVDWEEHKKKHDELYKKVSEGGLPLPVPDHFIAYKMVPDMMEFYYAYNCYIGDRMMYLKKAGGKWEHTRIAA